jgi:hypothetical protein
LRSSSYLSRMNPVCVPLLSVPDESRCVPLLSVPEGLVRRARRFSVGFGTDLIQVPKGRLNLPDGKKGVAAKRSQKFKMNPSLALAVVPPPRPPFAPSQFDVVFGDEIGHSLELPELGDGPSMQVFLPSWESLPAIRLPKASRCRYGHTSPAPLFSPPKIRRLPGRKTLRLSPRPKRGKRVNLITIREIIKFL